MPTIRVTNISKEMQMAKDILNGQYNTTSDNHQRKNFISSNQIISDSLNQSLSKIETSKNEITDKKFNQTK